LNGTLTPDEVPYGVPTVGKQFSAKNKNEQVLVNIVEPRFLGKFT